MDLVGADDIEIACVGSGEEAMERLIAESFDCMVTDLDLPVMSGLSLVEAIQANAELQKLQNRFR